MIETLWNMIFNALFSLTPFTKYLLDENTFMLIARPLITNSGYLYYAMDSFWEIVNYNRYIYIPHHICSVYLFYMFKNHDYNYEELHEMLFVFAMLEYTTLFLNIRDHLKKINKLHVIFDLALYFQYIYIRCYLFIIYSYTLMFYYHNTLPKIMNVILILMSYYWVFLWSKSLIKQINKKIYKLSAIL